MVLEITENERQTTLEWRRRAVASITVILKYALMSFKVVFHFISIQGDGSKIPGNPRKNRIPWDKSVNSSFPGFELVFGEVFQAI